MGQDTLLGFQRKIIDDFTQLSSQLIDIIKIDCVFQGKAKLIFSIDGDRIFIPVEVIGTSMVQELIMKQDMLRESLNTAFKNAVDLLERTNEVLGGERG